MKTVIAFCLVTGAISAVQAADPAQEPAARRELHASQHPDPESIPWEEGMLAPGTLGSDTNPVLCSGPPGEREYLNRLRCSNGEAPAYERSGSFGDGPDGHVIDGYDVVCEDYRVTMFMDMYHRDHMETAPVGAFRMGLGD